MSKEIKLERKKREHTVTSICSMNASSEPMLTSTGPSALSVLVISH
jgi:hypothetical protein